MLVEVACFAASLVITIVAVPMWAGRIPLNRWYGYRTSRSMADATTWYAANRIAGRDLIVGSLTSAVVLLLLIVSGDTVAARAVWLAPAIFGLAVLGAVARSTWLIELHNFDDQVHPSSNVRARRA